MRRCLVLAILALTAACWDGGPFMGPRVPHNPCHPGYPYEVEQPYPESCPVPNR